MHFERVRVWGFAERQSVRTRQMLLKRIYAMDMYRCLSQLISRYNQLQAHIALVQEKELCMVLGIQENAFISTT